jgi:hypothetical protein
MFIYEKNIKGVDNSECSIILTNDSIVLFLNLEYGWHSTGIQ